VVNCGSEEYIRADNMNVRRPSKKALARELFYVQFVVLAEAEYSDLQLKPREAPGRSEPGVRLGTGLVL
jgi:hypothetical protein